MKTLLSLLTKGLIVLFGIISIAAVAITLFKPEWIKIAIEWVGSLIETLGYWNFLIAFSSALIESLPVIGNFLPGMNIMILVGGFWGKSHLLVTIILAAMWAMIGNYVGYWIGKRYGKYIIANYGEYIGIGKTEQKILENQIAKNGFWYIALGKFHGFLRAFIPFIAGASDMGAKKFWLYNMIGSVIWATTINLLWLFFIDQYEMILDNIGKILTLLMIVVIAYLFLFKKASLQKYWRDKQTEIEEKQQKSCKQPTIPIPWKQTWEVQHENITIRVENSWTWGGIVKEKILINDEVVYEYFGKMQSIGLCKHFCVDGHNITVKLGSKWHMLGTACQIWIDDRVVCGDQWVLFANKTS